MGFDTYGALGGVNLGRRLGVKSHADPHIEFRQCMEPKRFHDVAAGYNRFDLFDFQVRRERLRPVHFDDIDEEKSDSFRVSEPRLVG